MTALDDLAKVGEGNDWIIGIFQDVRQDKLKGAVDRLNDIAGNVRKVAADMDWRGEAADQAKAAFMTLASKLNEHADAINAIRQADADTHDPISDAREAWNFLQIATSDIFDGALLEQSAYEGEEPEQTRERLAREAMSKLDSGMNAAQSRIATGVTWDLDVPPAVPAGPPVPYGPYVPTGPQAPADPTAPAPGPHGNGGANDPQDVTGGDGGGSGGTGNGGGGGGAPNGGGGGGGGYSGGGAPTGGGGGGGGSTPQVHANPVPHTELQVGPVTGGGHGGGDASIAPAHGGGHGGGAHVEELHQGGGQGHGQGHGQSHGDQVIGTNGNDAQGNGLHGNGAPGNAQHVQWQDSDGQWHNATGHQVQWQDAHGQWHDAAGTGDHPHASQVRWQDAGGQWHQADGQWEDAQGQWHEARGPDATAVAEPATGLTETVQPTATDGVDVGQPVDAPPPVADPAPAVDAPAADAAPADAPPADAPPADAAPREDLATILARRLGGDAGETTTVDVAAAARSSV